MRARLSAAALVAVAAIALAPATSDAQRGGRGNPLRGGGPGQGMSPEQRLLQILRDRLELTDAQVERFRETNLRFRERRLRLGMEERQTRGAMRDLICSGDTTRGADMARLLDQWQDVGRRRLDLESEEQKDLATFLSPYQRAKYIGFEEQLARLLDGRGGGRGGPPPPDGFRDGRGGRGGRGGDGPPAGGGPGGRGGPPPLISPDGCGSADSPGPAR
jgi:Spy/CpxP family protein refolding chaperone